MKELTTISHDVRPEVLKHGAVHMLKQDVKLPKRNTFPTKLPMSRDV